MTSPPSNNENQIIKTSIGRRRSTGVIALLGVSPEAEHMLALNDIKPERIFFMALSLAVILGAGYTFPSILGSYAVESVTFSENHNKIWVLVYSAFGIPAWYGGALLFLKHAQPHLQQRNPPCISFWGITSSFGGRHKLAFDHIYQSGLLPLPSLLLWPEHHNADLRQTLASSYVPTTGVGAFNYGTGQDDFAGTALRTRRTHF